MRPGGWDVERAVVWNQDPDVERETGADYGGSEPGEGIARWQGSRKRKEEEARRGVADVGGEVSKLGWQASRPGGSTRLHKRAKGCDYKRRRQVPGMVRTMQ